MTEPEWVIHLGVTPANLTRVRRELNQRGAEVLDVEGDGWNTWSEPVGTDVNDHTTLHLAALTDGTQADAIEVTDALIALAESGAGFELATSSEGLRTLAVVTTADDYNVQDSGGHVWSRDPARGIVRTHQPGLGSRRNRPLNPTTTSPTEGVTLMPTPQPGELAADALLCNVQFQDPHFVIESGPGRLLMQHTGQNIALGMGLTSGPDGAATYEWTVGSLSEGAPAPTDHTGDATAAKAAVDGWVTDAVQAQRTAGITAHLGTDFTTNGPAAGPTL